MTRITLEQVGQKVDDYHEFNKKEFKQIDEHLKKLNGQVERNTKWRHIFKGGLGVLIFLMSIGLIKIFS